MKPFQKHEIRIAEVAQSFFLGSLRVCRLNRKTDDIGIECCETLPSVNLPFAYRYRNAETLSKAQDPNSQGRICCAANVLARSPRLHKISEKSKARRVA